MGWGCMHGCMELIFFRGIFRSVSFQIARFSGEPELSSGLASLAVTVGDERSRPRSDSRSEEATALEVRCVVGDPSIYIHTYTYIHV